MATFKMEMTFLGMESRESKKTGKGYFLAKFMEMKSQQIYEFYVPGDRIDIAQPLADAKILVPMPVVLKMSAFNGKPQVDIDGIA